MGREIYDIDLDGVSYKAAKLGHILKDVKQLDSDELSAFFSALFARMTIRSKEALTEVLWTGLGPEQEHFEMPYFSQRWGAQALNDAFTDAFREPVTALIRRQGMIDQMSILRIGSLRTSQPLILTDRSIAQTLSPSTEATVIRPFITAPRSTGTSTINTSHTSPSYNSSNLSSNHMSMDSEFYSILRMAINRAENAITRNGASNNQQSRRGPSP